MMRIRKKIYILLALAFVAAVLFRQGMVRRGRNKEIVSTISQWDELGKPVTVRSIIKDKVREYARFPVTFETDNIASGFVTGDLQERLRQSQEVYLEDQSAEPVGIITGISREMDMDTGMFYVQVQMNVPLPPDQSVIVVYVHTGTYQNSIAVPNEILEIEGDEFFLWKAVEGRASRVRVGVGTRNGYGAIITAGLDEGDRVICSGQSQLKDGDKIRAVTMRQCEPGAAQEVGQ